MSRRLLTLSSSVNKDKCWRCNKIDINNGVANNSPSFFDFINNVNNHWLSATREQLKQSQGRRFYFTNGDAVKKDDPYAQLGLTWGATTSEIKEAYKQKARELHPDVNKDDKPEVAIKKFQTIQKAYSRIMNFKTSGDESLLEEEWSFGIWRTSDIIAQDRTDVAGVMKKRPAKPASSTKKQFGYATLGHPDGSGNNSSIRRRGEYLADGNNGGAAVSKGRTSASVGTGRNKWVTPKEFVPFNPDTDLKIIKKKKRES